MNNSTRTESSSSVSVAVVGASGIGRHHGKWWTVEGARVCAFAGRTEQSVAQTRTKLQDLFGFDGRGYTCLETMLATERPDIVDVCTPAKHHYAATKAALKHGCHVLCEKPFVYDPDLPTSVVTSQARELVDLATANGRRLGLCTQYAAVTPMLLGLLREHGHIPNAIGRFSATLASPLRNNPPLARVTWIDLAPHLLAAAQMLVPDGVPDWETLSVDVHQHEARAEFLLLTPGRSSVGCAIRVFRTTTEPSHVRTFTLNDITFELGGVNGPDGHYSTSLDTPWGQAVKPDLMRLVMREFLAGTATVPGETALRNLEWTLRVLQQIDPA